jgi:hypothetical protein
VDPRDSLDELVKRKFLTLPGLELRPLCRPTCSQTLYPLRYPGSILRNESVIICSFNKLKGGGIEAWHVKEGSTEQIVVGEPEGNIQVRRYG